MDYEFLDVRIVDQVATIMINRPEVLNGLHPESHREMEMVWKCPLDRPFPFPPYPFLDI